MRCMTQKIEKPRRDNGNVKSKKQLLTFVGSIIFNYNFIVIDKMYCVTKEEITFTLMVL